mmetsp:Transcript_19893/g.36709  ORF Transcript_19893/g.36709 Transcript_19893/m.36709 type:complete len:386 (+) Transcript_19893:3045-4202(+)
MDFSSEVTLLVNSNRLDDAVLRITEGFSKLTPSDNHLLDKLIENLIKVNRTDEVAQILIEILKSPLKISSIFLQGYVKSIVLKGKTHLGFNVFSSYIKKDRIKDASDLTGFIDVAAGRGEGGMVLELMQLARDYFLTTDESYWRSVTKSLLRAGLIEHASDAMKFVATSGVISEFVWQPFIEECLNTSQHDLLFRTLTNLGSTNAALTTRVWNLFLRQIGKTSGVEEEFIKLVLDYLIQKLPSVKIEEATLTSVFTKLISLSRQSGLVHYLKQMKTSVTTFVVSSLLMSLIDKNIVRDGLEIVSLAVNGYFGPNVSLSTLSLNALAWQWIVREQQLQISKFGKRSSKHFQGQTDTDVVETEGKSVEESVLFNLEVSDDEEFVFIE